MPTFGKSLSVRPPVTTNFCQFDDRLARCEANWSRRRAIVNYCVGVVDESVDEKRQTLQDAGDDASVQRKARGALYAEEVKVGRRMLPPLTASFR